MLTAPDGAPENVTGSATSSTSIRLTWDTPARNLQNGYIVEYRVIVTETNTGMASTSTVTDRSLTLTSLHPYYIYSCSVAAVTVGIGPYSVAINVTTDEDGETLHCTYVFSLYCIVSKLQFQLDHHRISQHCLLLHLWQTYLGHLPLMMNKMVSLSIMSSI